MNLSHPTSLDALGDLARARLHQSLDRHESASVIARQLSQLTGKIISRFAVRRYATNYLAVASDEAKARTETKQITQAVAASGDAVSDLLAASLRESLALAKSEGRLRRLNPLLLEQADRRRRELAIKERAITLAERRVDVIESRFKIDKGKADKLIADLELKSRRGESVTAEQIKQIREIYGVYEQLDAALTTRPE